MIDGETCQGRLVAALRDRGIDAALLSSPGNVCYSSGVEVCLPIDAGTEFAGGPALALADADGNVRVLVPEAHADPAACQITGAELVAVPGFSHFEARDPKGLFLGAVRDLLRTVGSGRVRLGIEPRWLPAGVHALLTTEFPGFEVVDVDEALLAARAVKTPWELERIRVAAAAADRAQECLRECLRVGVNELALWGEVTHAACEVAGRAVPIVGEIVSGPRTGVVRYPGGPIDRAVERGDTVIMDFSVRVDGYWADCCNTLVADAEPGKTQLRCYEASRDALRGALAALVPGHSVHEAERASRAALAGYGFEPVHYAGHQIGVVVNEPPRLVPYDRSEIRTGMVFALEPGAYAGERAGTGARCEAMAVVTDEGPDLMSKFTWGMDAYRR